MAKLRSIGLRKLIVTVPTAGQRKAISSERLFVTDFEIFVKSANSGANMYVGNKDVDNTWIPRAKGTSWNFVHGTGNFIGRDPVVGFDLSEIYLDADANGDVAIIQYYAVDRTDK